MSKSAESYQPETDAVLGVDGNPGNPEGEKTPESAETPSASAPSYNATSMASTVAPIPRISIQVFCDQAETAAVFQKAAEDRRLSKAHIGVQMGGSVGAAEHFRDLPTPNLLVVECVENGGSVFEQLQDLADVCDPSTKVVVIGKLNDISIYRELIRHGISEYLVSPLDPIQVIESISALYVDPDAPPIGRNIAFVAARGGAGSSTIAHNVGWHIAEKITEDVTIVDLDLAFGTAGLNFNQDPTQGIGDAITSPERVDDVLLDRLLVKCSNHLSLFASPSHLDRDYDADPIAFENVLDIVRKTVPYVVIDLPHAWTPWSRGTLLAADEIVIVATPDLASLRNTKNFLELLKTSRPNDNSARLVMNQVGMPKRPEIPVKDFCETVGLDATLTIPFDPNLFGTAANNGQMLYEIDQNAVGAKEIASMANIITGRGAVDDHKKNDFLNRLKSKIRSA